MDLDYKKLGLRIGLEAHQQLAGKKLFCSCPCVIKDDISDFTVERRLHASASELGKVDAAALYEQQKGKFFVYKGYHDTNCLVELDEEPPHAVNADALDCALQVALLLHCQLVDEVQFMRKVVIDGSNVSAFQRTALLGVGGYIMLSNGKRVGISSVCLEEESARKVDDSPERRIYNISRLGIPLIEIATDPDMNTPEEAREAAAELGMILRSVEGMRRGLGSIRQDVNVSLKRSNRVEIKGFQDLKSIVKVIAHEVKRQKRLLDKKEKTSSHVRKAEADCTSTFLRPMPGAARMYPETDVPRIVLDKKRLDAIELPETIAEKVLALEEKYGLKADYAREIVHEYIDIDAYVSAFSLDANYIASVLLEVPKSIKKRFKLDTSVLTRAHFEDVLRAVASKEIAREAVLEVLCEVCRSGTFDLAPYRKVSAKELESAIAKIVAKNKGAPFGALMGLVMKKYRGRADGKLISELIRKCAK